MTKSRYRDGFLIGFSHPTASYFLLLRQKKVAKEKAARYRFLLALLGFVGGSAERASCPPADVRHPCRTPFGLFPTKPAVLGAANGC